MKKLLKITLIAFSAMLVSCSGGSQANTVNALDGAEEALHNGDYRRAIEICDELTGSADTSAITATQYCRIASVYAVAADSIVDNETVMAHAVNALGHAMALNADSVNLYMSQLSVEGMAALRMPMQLLAGRGADMSQYTDSEGIPVDHDIDPADTLAHSHEEH